MGEAVDSGWRKLSGDVFAHRVRAECAERGCAEVPAPQSLLGSGQGMLRLQRERDEARAEVERLRGLLMQLREWAAAGGVRGGKYWTEQIDLALKAVQE